MSQAWYPSARRRSKLRPRSSSEIRVAWLPIAVAAVARLMPAALRLVRKAAQLTGSP
jgi:hypothetical protein